MKKILFIVVLGLSTQVFAKDCEEGATTAAEVRFCMENESQAEVDKVYASLVKQLKSKNKQLLDYVTQSQKSWTAYKNDSCQVAAEIQFSAGRGGYRGDYVTSCIMDFNAARVKILQRYIKDL